MLSLKVLNSDATLNNFFELGTLQIVRGEDAKIILQLFQSQKKIRYISAAGATITASFLKSDGTTIDKTASLPFADDRSIIQFDLDETETAELISQNIMVDIEEGAILTKAFLQMGLQVINTSQGC